jgi:hypothetical protein
MASGALPISELIDQPIENVSEKGAVLIGQSLSALRPNGKPLSESAAGYGVWGREL